MRSSIIATLALFLFLIPSAASAQVRGWCTVVGAGQSECFPDPLSACYRQYQVYSHPANAFEGYKEHGVFSKLCDWVTHVEGGHLGPLPTVVLWHCDIGYAAVAPGLCVQRPMRQREMCSSRGGGSPNPTDGTNPIILSTGTKYQREDDYLTADGRFDLTRYYRTGGNSSLPFVQAERRSLDSRWRFSFEYSLHVSSAMGTQPYVVVYLPDGSTYDFQRQTNGTMLPVGSDGPQSGVKLEYVGTWPATLNTLDDNPTQWRLTTADNKVVTLQTFPSDVLTTFVIGRPTSIVDSSGYALNFTYDAQTALSAIVDSFGKAFTFTWLIQDPAQYGGTNGPRPRAVSRVDFPDGTAVRYSYNSAFTGPALPFQFPDRLAQVEYLDAANNVSGVRQYLYENGTFPYNLTGVIDERGVRTASWQYDSLGRATSSEGANGLNRYTVSYSDTATNATRTVTNPLGKQSVYSFDRAGYATRLRSVTGTPSANCIGTLRTFNYDNQGFLTSVVGANGAQTRYVRDTLGRITELKEAFGTPIERVTTIAWHPFWRLPTSVVSPLLQTSYSYNSIGQQTARIETDRNTLASRAWNYWYQPNGLLSAIDGPLPGPQDTTNYSHSTAGYLQSVTNPLGHTVQFPTHNGRGYPTRVIDENGVRSDLSFDARSRLTQVVSDVLGTPRTWSYQYSLAGDLTSLTDPTSRVFTYSHDSTRRLTDARLPSGGGISVLRDMLGDVTYAAIKNSNGITRALINQTFDELGRQIGWTGAANQSWNLVYDAEGNIASQTDPRGGTVDLNYDFLNQLTGVRDEDQSLTTILRNPHGAVSTVTDVRGVTTQYTRNAWNDVTTEQSAEIGAIAVTRNELGLVTNKIDGRGVTTTQTFDSAGRVLSRQFPSNSAYNVTFGYDDITGGNNGRGKLTSVSDFSGVTRFEYDAQDYLRRKTVSNAQIQTQVTYAYDAAGRLIGMGYPSGRSITFQRDTDGQIQEIRDVGSLITGITWEPYGPNSSLRYGNGIGENRNYSRDYRLSELFVSSATQKILALQYEYGDGINLTEIKDLRLLAPLQKYRYSLTNRLLSALGFWGQISLTYDRSGNRLTQKLAPQVGSSISEIYNTTPGTNQLQSVVSGNTRSFAYDGAGAQVSDQNGSVLKSYTYSPSGQLESVSLNSSPTGGYIYNAAHQLVTRITGSGFDHYIYDEAGHLIAELDGAGVVTREYVWLEDRPIVMFDRVASGIFARFFIHTDHLDRPVVVTDAAGLEVWRAEYKPWGEVQIVTQSVSMEMRLPGQLMQSESGLHYNWHRHYDPTTGRYVQADPIGLRGGLHRYDYGMANPLSNIDPDGQLMMQIGAALSIASILAGEGIFYVVGQWEFREANQLLNRRAPSTQTSCNSNNPNGIEDLSWEAADQEQTSLPWLPMDGEYDSILPLVRRSSPLRPRPKNLPPWADPILRNKLNAMRKIGVP